MRRQPIAKIVMVAMILKNAYVTMNANQSSEYFIARPPSFEEWTSQGPRARPIPEDSIFHPDYRNDSDLDSSDSDNDSGSDDDNSSNNSIRSNNNSD